VLILGGAHLCRNPRVLKEATTLARHGMRVEVLGGWTEAALRDCDEALLAGAPFRFTPAFDATRAGRGARLARRALTKAAGFAWRAAGVQSAAQLGRAATALVAAVRERPAELVIAHNEFALPAAASLLERGRRVGVDMEDWYSEDLAPEARRHRPVAMLRRLEGELLRACAHSSCPSHAMSVALAADYGCRPPVVIYNAFPLAERARLDGERRDRRTGPVSIHWFSQTLAPGRGLEDLFAALPLLRGDFEVHLRGRPAQGFAAWLDAAVAPGLRPRVRVHALVDPRELPSRIAEHDIGFAGEMTYARSRDLTVSNKLLQYLLGGLAVVASDTQGQAEVARAAPGAVALYRGGSAEDLASRLNALLADPARLASAKAAASAAAEREFCWERQEATLLASVAAALDGPGPP